ncbi:transglutaminase family protein [Methylocystis sp. L43]|uniref:transglutaminase N-terminal domain-containing protein n=1 Tax=unclassified Methylocystis TaxID=2625913 RepID=UPI0018C248D7|nr:transglutaminase family protein [Methylocystis sp. L43]MBG0807438.1 transglutaminase family protein [Methylocystis sp. H15]
MIYDIAHRTIYKYDAPVASARCAMRLIPRNDRGQTLLSHRIELSPSAEILNERIDFHGNRVCEARILKPHTRLQIALAARVAVERAPPPAPALTPAWENVRNAAYAADSLAASSPAHYIYASRFAPLFDAATHYARESFSPGRPILEGAIDLTQRIHADFAYDPDATHIATPIAQAFERRRGVCQDFAHIMIAALRGLGLAASYVSGYLRTFAAPGQARLEGADSTHAWVSVWCGPEFGFYDLDPTNALVVGNDHVAIAIGRDYADVSPIDGVIIGAGDQDLDVSVDVKEAAI